MEGAATLNARLEEPETSPTDLCPRRAPSPWEWALLDAVRSVRYGQVTINMMDGHPERMVTSTSHVFGKPQKRV